jgi:hypothetical protein
MKDEIRARAATAIINLANCEHEGFDSQYRFHLDTADLIKTFLSENDRLQKDLDAASSDLRCLAGCKACKNSKCYMRNGREHCHFEWHGRKEQP